SDLSRSPTVKCGFHRDPRPSGFIALISRAAISKASVVSRSHATVCLRLVPKTTVPTLRKLAGITGGSNAAACSTTSSAIDGENVMVMCGVWCCVGKPRSWSLAKISRTCCSSSLGRYSRMFSGDAIAVHTSLWFRDSPFADICLPGFCIICHEALHEFNTLRIFHDDDFNTCLVKLI